jgi:putative transposase
MSKYNPYIHHRRSIRLREYDYSQQGGYFITICAKSKECIFGQIVNGEMRFNEAGYMVKKTWNNLSSRYSSIEIDEFIVMPNHMHAIIMIVGAPLVGAHSFEYAETMAGTRPWAGTRPAPTLGEVVGEFKSITTRLYIEGVRQKNWTQFNGKLWQRNYYEHIVRNEEDLDQIRRYIIMNPMQWHTDENNPANATSLNP